MLQFENLELHDLNILVFCFLVHTSSELVLPVIIVFYEGIEPAMLVEHWDRSDWQQLALCRIYESCCGYTSLRLLLLETESVNHQLGLGELLLLQVGLLDILEVRGGVLRVTWWAFVVLNEVQSFNVVLLGSFLLHGERVIKSSADVVVVVDATHQRGDVLVVSGVKRTNYVSWSSRQI